VSFSDLIGRLDTLDGMVRGIEGLVNNLETYRNPNPPTAEGEAKPPTQPAADLSYVLLENRYRGSEEEIARRLEIYPEIFKAAPGTILEIGSGRGELQRLFKERSLSSYGVDLDPAMVNVATSRGLNTLHGDGIAHLRSLEDRSLGGLVAIQVVEHLTRDQLHELFTLVKTKLRPGARAVFETINPQSLLALSSNYFRDPTHVWPLHPDTLGYMATLAGLAIVETRYLSPVSPNQLLLPIPVDTALKPNVAEAIRRVNMNIEQLNKILYGFQDYCLVVEVA
jgi:O-antigen chain-terminating methyltransferase